MHGDYGAGWMVVMMVGMVIFWGAIVLAVVWLIRGGSERAAQKQEETALEILDRRFAEGQMSVEEYRERRAELTGNQAPRASGAASAG
jgi:putative membrane protein